MSVAIMGRQGRVLITLLLTLTSSIHYIGEFSVRDVMK